MYACNIETLCRCVNVILSELLRILQTSALPKEKMYGQENLIHELCLIQRTEHCIAKYVIESGALYTKSIWRLISDGRCSSPLSSSILPLLPPAAPPGHYQSLQYHQLWIQMIKIICKMKFFFERRPVNTVGLDNLQKLL